jgi:hypothetical protein
MQAEEIKPEVAEIKPEVAEIKPEVAEIKTYDQWCEQQCNFGYDVDEDLLCDWIESTSDAVGESNGIGKATLVAYVFPPSSTKFKPNRRTVDYSIGNYLGDSAVVWEVIVKPENIPHDSKLRTLYPLAFSACTAGFWEYVRIDIAHSARFPRAEITSEWADGGLELYEPVKTSDIYDGMMYEDYEQIAQEQIEQLEQDLMAIYEQMCEQVTLSLWSDYEWFYSEERYKEEMNV